jgi:anti-anti-sigma factor
MSKPRIVEIHFQNSEMMVAPSLKAINRRKSAGQISAEVKAALAQTRPELMTGVVIDLCHVSWISSAGLNELIQLRNSARAAGVSLRLRSLSETVAEVIRLTRLERIFDIDGDSANNPNEVSRPESIENQKRDSFVSV